MSWYHRREGHPRDIRSLAASHGNTFDIETSPAEEACHPVNTPGCSQPEPPGVFEVFILHLFISDVTEFGRIERAFSGS